MRGRRPILGFLLALALLARPPGALAAGTIDTARGDCTLTVTFLTDGAPAEDVDFSLYRVGVVDAYGAITMLDGCELDLDSGNLSTEVAALAETLETEQAAHETATTGASGTAAFTGLAPGLYIVTGGTCLYNGNDYTPVPALAVLPHDESGAWSYEGTVEVIEAKAMRSEPAVRSLTVRQTVTGNMGSRAEAFSFTASFQNAAGEPIPDDMYGVAEVKNGACGFTLRHGEYFVFEGLPAGTEWTLTQSAPDGYAVESWSGNERTDGAARTGALLTDTAVEFVSDRTVGVLTSVDERLAPVRIVAVGMLTAGLAGTAIILLQRRRKGGRA